MPGQSSFMDYIDRLTDCVLVAYLEFGGSVDNPTLARYVQRMIEGEYSVERGQLATHLIEAGKRLRMQALIKRVKMPGKKGPGVWRLTLRGKHSAGFIRDTKFSQLSSTTEDAAKITNHRIPSRNSPRFSQSRNQTGPPADRAAVLVGLT